MGVILATEAVVGVAEAAEGAGAVEGIASASEAGEAISSGTEAGAEAGSQAGEDAAGAAEAGGSALESVLQTLNQGLVKLEKMVTEYMVIDAVFKAAKKIVTALFSDPSAQVRAKKLEKLIKVLSQSSSHLKDLIDWLKAHSRDEVDIKNIAVTLQGVLSKFIPQLGAAVSIIKVLSNQISKKNSSKEPVTDGEIIATEHSLQMVLSSFKSLAEFKAQHKDRVPQLDGLPIDNKIVASMQAEMPK